MDPLIANLELHLPANLLQALEPYWSIFALELVCAVFCFRRFRVWREFRHSDATRRLRNEEQGWLAFPLLLWALFAVPPIFQCGLGLEWDSYYQQEWMRIFGAFFALASLLAIRSIWLSLLSRPAAGAGLGSEQLAVFGAVFVGILVLNLVPALVLL